MGVFYRADFVTLTYIVFIWFTTRDVLVFNTDKEEDCVEGFNFDEAVFFFELSLYGFSCCYYFTGLIISIELID